jgi:mono/diheme cytochrome c family protein
MPAFGDRFSDREIAAVGTYVRNAWTNEFGAISEEEVSALR